MDFPAGHPREVTHEVPVPERGSISPISHPRNLFSEMAMELYSLSGMHLEKLGHS